MSGTEHRSKDELDNEIDYIGASLSAGRNSMRMSCLTKHMNKGLALMADVLMYANFPQDEVDRIIKMNESNLLSTKSDAGSMAGNAQAVANFPNGTHPYGEVMTEATLANITRDHIVQYYKSTFTPKGSYMVVVGDINKEELTTAIETHFSKWSGVDVTKNELGGGTPNNGNRVIFVNKPGAVQSVIYVTFPIDMNPGHPDYLKLRVLNGVLGGGGFGTRLMQNLREDKAYTYGCYSRLNIDEHGSTFSAGGNFRNEVTDSAITELLYEIEHITDGYVLTDEINLTKSAMNGSFSRSLESPSTVANFALSIIKNELPKDYYQTYLQRLEAITVDDLLEVAHKYITPKNCNIIVVGNEEILGNIEKFDADGVIEKMDAFGGEVIELKESDRTADEVFAEYIYKVTMTDSDKKLTKKMKKLKSVTTIIEFTNPQFPGAMKATEHWVGPETSASQLEMQGMVFQSSYFDGEAGYEKSAQTGKKELSPVQIEAKNKSLGAFAEVNYNKSGMTYSMEGIETKSGKDYYLIKMNDGESEIYEYYSVDDFLKLETKTITSRDGETVESTRTYNKYEEVDGFLFPMEQNVMFGNFSLTGKVVEIKTNEKVDLGPFKE
jgi:predicted Zn-dependent peptidase